MSISLFTYTQQGMPLPDALAAFASVIGIERATAILYSPQRCSLAIFSGAALLGKDGQPLDTTSVFEARVFNGAAELRWLNDPSTEQRHRAVLLTEIELSQLSSHWNQTETRTVEDGTLEQTYLLWGKGTGRPLHNGWSELATARIGALSVPVDNVRQNQRVLLRTAEYLIESDDGNVIVFDERLCKLEVENA